jgi:hypothetical protein
MLANRARLATHGIHVPETRTNGYRRAHHRLAWEFHNAKTRVFAPGGFDALQIELESLDTPEHILVSSEDFESRLCDRGNLERLHRTFAAMGYRLRLLAYIRPQVAYINSSYTQLTKMLASTLDIDAFVAQALKRARFDYERSLLPAVHFDAIDTAFRPFNGEILTGGIARDFLSALDLGARAIAEMDFPPSRNSSPGPKTVAAGLAIGRKLAEQGIKLKIRHRRKVSHLVRELGDFLGWNTTRFSGITSDHARAIRDRFATGNKVFATTVWQRSWQDVYGQDGYTAPALNVFDPDTASREDKSEFDEVLETAWHLLNHHHGDSLGYDDAIDDTV